MTDKEFIKFIAKELGRLPELDNIEIDKNHPYFRWIEQAAENDEKITNLITCMENHLRGEK